MIRSTRMMLVTLACGAALVFGCETFKDMTGQDKGKKMAAGKTAVAKLAPSKAAATMPANKNVAGTVTFTETADNKVRLVAHVTGLEPNTKHGFHIHEKPDMSSPDLMSTGGHWNPDGHAHGGPSTSPVHAGDFGNLTADANGVAHLELTVANLSIGTGAKNDIIGKPVIVHAKEDDLKTQPSGNAGARVSGGLIELQK